MKKIHISKRFWIGAGIVIFALSVVLTSGVLARYVQTQEPQDDSVTAKAFYFESNYLTEDNHEYKLNPGTTSVDFKLSNYETEARVSEVDSIYTITVTSTDTSFTIDGEVVTQKTLLANKNEKTDKTVTLGNLKDGYSYSVTVTANGGYTKTLSATFSVVSTKNGFFMNVNSFNDKFVILTVWTENVSGDVTIEVPAGLVPDTTEPLLANIQNCVNGEYQEFTFSDTEHFDEIFMSYKYRFFKTEDYDPNQEFVVTMNGRTAEIKTNLSKGGQ